MSSTSLRLENYFIEELFFIFRPTAKVAEAKRFGLAESDLQIEVARSDIKDNPQKKLCRVAICLADERKNSFPYDFKIDLVGSFEIDAKVPDETKDALLRNTAPSILFTAARELLLVISSRSIYGPLMLPTVSFPRLKLKPFVESPVSKGSTVKKQPLKRLKKIPRPSIKTR